MSGGLVAGGLMSGPHKYLDTLLINQPISDDEAADHCQKVTSQDGRLPELIVARSCLTNHSEAAAASL